MEIITFIRTLNFIKFIGQTGALVKKTDIKEKRAWRYIFKLIFSCVFLNQLLSLT